MTDAVDILFVAALVYMAIVWIRRTHAAQVATGILILALVYVAARAFGLQLTAWIFQGFFAIFVIIIVVIFQEELRQLFERVAIWSLRRGEQPGLSFDPTDILVECLSDFAEHRVGALVIVPGKQPILRHLQGGIELNGRLSVPLLRSIFDPHSPGHDGAVIIEDGRVSRFAVHLPLSKDARQLAGVGTRHAAALGLAELTDALCLVVSEERGRISAAHEARLYELRHPHELGQWLETFFAARRPSPDRGAFWTHLLRRNWVEKVASLGLVLGLWYLFVPGSRPAQVAYQVPVKVVNLPGKYALEEVTPPHVQVTLAGPARAFYLFDEERLEAEVDASLTRQGRRTFQISPENLRHPKEFTVEDIEPAKVKISVREVPDKTRGAAGAARD